LGGDEAAKNSLRYERRRWIFLGSRKLWNESVTTKILRDGMGSGGIPRESKNKFLGKGVKWDGS